MTFLHIYFQNLYYFDMLFASYRIYHKFMSALVFLDTVVLLEIVFIFGLCLVLSYQLPCFLQSFLFLTAPLSLDDTVVETLFSSPMDFYNR